MTWWEHVLDWGCMTIGFCFFVITGRIYTGMFVKKRTFPNKAYEYALLAANTIVLLVNLWVLRDVILIKLLFMVLWMFLFMCLTFEFHFLKILFSVITHFTMIVVLDYMVPITLSIFIPTITWEVVYDSVWAPVMSLMGIVIQFGIALFIKKYIINQYAGGLSKGEWVYFLVFPIVTSVIFFLSNIMFGFVENDVQKKIVTMIAVGLLAMNIAMFCLIKNIMRREARIRERELFLERVKNDTERYRNISKNYDLQRKREHEYKNQMSFIAALAGGGKIEELNNYLKDYNKNSVVKMNAIDTNNVIVNAIINSKYQEAREKKIVFVVKINDLSGLKLKEEDIVLILSNLLNNAMEACENCENGVIKFKFMKERSGVILSVANSLSVKPVVIDDAYVTTKTEYREAHGIGIQNIKEVVESYGGQYVIRHDEHEFHFAIYIPQ